MRLAAMVGGLGVLVACSAPDPDVRIDCGPVDVVLTEIQAEVVATNAEAGGTEGMCAEARKFDVSTMTALTPVTVVMANGPQYHILIQASPD